MSSNRDFILREAFGQYLEYGYDGVSISVLQDSTQLGRATLYYYFTNKENLFREVINEYVIKLELSFLEKLGEKALNILQLIQIHTERIDGIIALIRKVNPKLRFTNYLSLILHAYAHDEAFKSFFDETRVRILDAWKQAIRKSISEGDLEEERDTEKLAILFSGLNECTQWEKTAEECVASDCTFIKNCHQLYEVIKKKEK